MKPAKEWIKDLDPVIKKKIEINLRARFAKHYKAHIAKGMTEDFLNTERPSMEAVLTKAFVWADTKEGHVYWYNIANQCEK